jgi:hypothetical protein
MLVSVGHIKQKKNKGARIKTSTFLIIGLLFQHYRALFLVMLVWPVNENDNYLRNVI